MSPPETAPATRTHFLVRLLVVPVFRFVAICLLPVCAAFVALQHAIEEDSIDEFAKNFWRCFSRVTWAAWHNLIGFGEAGYYRLFRETGGCDGWTFHQRRPENPEQRQWVRGNGYSA